MIDWVVFSRIGRLEHKGVICQRYQVNNLTFEVDDNYNQHIQGNFYGQ